MTVKEYLEKYMANKYPEIKNDYYTSIIWEYSCVLSEFSLPLESKYDERFKRRLEIRMDALIEWGRIRREEGGV